MNNIYQKILIQKVYVTKIQIDGLFCYIFENINKNQKKIISNVNAHAITLAFNNKRFENFLNQSEIVFCDGFGVDLAARFLYRERLFRFTPPDWIPKLCDLCEKEGFSIFILGSKQENAHLAATNLKRNFPDLIISGVYHGYFNKNKTSDDNQGLIRKINESKTNILFVGFGMPMQEFWIEENYRDLNVNIILPIGAAIDYLAGTTKRAPKWMTDHGFEWLGRLIIEPKRLWKRYILGLPVFFFRVILQKFNLLKNKDL